MHSGELQRVSSIIGRGEFGVRDIKFISELAFHWPSFAVRVKEQRSSGARNALGSMEHCILNPDADRKKSRVGTHGAKFEIVPVDKGGTNELPGKHPAIPRLATTGDAL